MKKLFSNLLYIILAATLSSCGENTDLTFEAPFPKSNKDLSSILGATLQLKSEGDTLALSITSSKAINLIKDTRSGDTLFYGTVAKYRGLYFFSEKVNDTSYHVFAVKTKGNLVYGLTEKWAQQRLLKEEVLEGNYPKLVKSISEDSFVIKLHLEKKALKQFYKNALTWFTPDTILTSSSLNKIPLQSQKKTSPVTIDVEELELVNNIYPNPVSDFLTVEVPQKSTMQYQLLDLNGKKMLAGTLKEVSNQIKMEHLPGGVYILNLHQNGQRESIRLVKK